ncbi:metal ABC transporter permease [Thermodesulforhabdus norvegica]|uniref:Zinc transport system permease protein n=1 Tax=Thermodesulforhabdus norvegica TaxID=39841 RepID=A0A1I4V916_9BACT|nr:metal ABC transporter permease [Thermodesulforhabdus norvegica]SFM97719.1 zinc transport system permease protein [Thermodesulforhabdus norvegica]
MAYLIEYCVNIDGERTEEMPDWMAWEVMKYAFLATFLAALAAGIVGSLVVVNRMVFLAGGIAHAAYGGVGIGIFFGIPLLPSTIGFSVLCSIILGYLSDRNRHRSDALIGTIWAAGMSIGALLINLSPGYRPDIMGYLFGSILTVTPTELRSLMLLDVVLIACCYFWYHELLAVSYDHEFATARGLSVRFFYNLLLIFSAVTVVFLMRLVGLILVIALLSIPAYMVEPRVPSLAHMFVGCTLVSLLFLIVGLLVALCFNLQPGPAIILTASTIFAVTEAFSLLRFKIRRLV